jgi:CheY-like chemotaxis protein
MAIMQDVPELQGLLQQLSKIQRSNKPKMLVVDDEPDNLDLLYRTFRREFQVFRAESGTQALEVLADKGEVAVIISDQRMPEMKGTEFLSRTVPKFPNTVRIILTGFTDVEDLVDAINSGQVYRYITKPWDPEELKILVQKAKESYEIQNDRLEDLRRAEAQTELIKAIVAIAKDAADLPSCLGPIAQALGHHCNADTCIFQLTDDLELTGVPGCYGVETENVVWLPTDPLVQKALTEKRLQGCLNIPEDPDLASLKAYNAHGVQAHLVFPLVYRHKILALLSLQWRHTFPFDEQELWLLYLAVQQVILALTCTAL